MLEYIGTLGEIVGRIYQKTIHTPNNIFIRKIKFSAKVSLATKDVPPEESATISRAVAATGAKPALDSALVRDGGLCSCSSGFNRRA